MIEEDDYNDDEYMESIDLVWNDQDEKTRTHILFEAGLQTELCTVKWDDLSSSQQEILSNHLNS